LRLAELIGALSLAADLASGMPSEKGLRSVVIAARLARRLGWRPEALTELFWVAALRPVGCVGWSAEGARYSAGDDNSLRKTMAYVDPSEPISALRSAVKGVAPDAPALDKAAGLVRFVLDRDLPRDHAQATCESGVFFSRSLGLPEAIATGLDATYERFDGRGPRQKTSMPASARLADVGDTVELFSWTGGAELARQVLKQRRGGALDPELVDAALGALPELIADLGGSKSWDEFLAAEPSPAEATEEQIDRGCVALGRFSDMKSVYTLAHTRRVAELATAAAEAAGLQADQRRLLERAAGVHDVGRVAVPNATWDKKAPLNALDQQRVRSHSHHTDLVLRGARLDALADIAGATHERGQGAGYHRRVPLGTLPLAARLLAAADVMAALGEERPHRPAFDDPGAVRELRALAESGALDGKAVQAVLEARGVTRGKKAAWPGGLSDREVEVARLVAIGRTNKDIGALLHISARTAQKHVMNVYDKLGLESRAGLALYAVEHGLLDEPEH
jgi:HD-GYP domain-containing protein (c-di-GMP phosphodiesterase class II)/DNA-binding CsgD family transcriptional regulator